MALRHSQICNVNPLQLKNLISDKLRKVRLIDCRSFLEYNDNHVVGAVNICCSKLIKRRLQQEKIALKDLLFHCRIDVEETTDVVVYDQKSVTPDDVSVDSFIYVLLKKLVLVFEKVYLLSGGFVSFHSSYPELCENKIWKFPGLSALSQPCLPTTSAGPTRILPFLYLGSEDDANNKELLQSHNITYELNVSNKCPKPDFIPDGHFLRIPVNDSHNEKLVSFFNQTYQFIEKVRGSNECVLVHCLAGISRSPTVAIAYVMRHLQMSCEDAYKYVKAKRATISPNFNFLGQLLEYEKQLISENILEKPLPPPPAPSFVATNTELLYGIPAVVSPPPNSKSSENKRINLSLRFCPFPQHSTIPSPKDASPTSAMARLQFDKPLGKENRTLASGGISPTGQPASPGLGFSLSRPTRIVKSSILEEESDSFESITKSVVKQSVSISFTKGFKNRKSSLEQHQHDSESLLRSSPDEEANSSGSKKCRIHKIIVEDSSSGIEVQPATISSQSSVIDESATSDVSSPMDQAKRDFFRSDSVSTSGIGSEISDHDLLTSASWEMNESGSVHDDGVFSDAGSLHAKSPRSSRSLQLWSSDSGHWSDEVMSSLGCSSSEVGSGTSHMETKSPEKRKFVDKLSPTHCNVEKRRSFAEPESSEWGAWSSSRPKRWSLAGNTPDSINMTQDNPHCSGSNSYLHCREFEDSSDRECESEGNEPSEAKGHLHFGHHWFNLLSGVDPTYCDRNIGLYRVNSCPGIVGYRDRIELHHRVPDSPSPPEPISDSVLLKVRSCKNRSNHQRSFHHLHPSPCLKNRFLCGNIDYDELLSKLQALRDKKQDSNHSSSSTLGSSSYSIVVQ